MEFQELVTELSNQTNYTKREIRHILRLLVKLIVENIVNGRDVQIWGLGRFRNLPAKARTGRHYITGARIDIPASRRLKFEPIIEIKNRVRESISLFKKESLEAKYGLPKKEKRHGKIWSSHRPPQSTQRKEGWSRR